MRFYDCATAPSPRLVRIFIAEKGLEVETREVDLRHGEHLAPAFRAINPYCTVPVLELDDGTRLTSTQACWRYLEEICPEPALLGRDPVERARIADLIWHIESDGWQAATEAFRNATPGLAGRALPGPDDYPQIAALAERGRLRTRRFLERLEGHLAPGPYLAGERFSAADILALVLVDFAAWIKLSIPAQAGAARAWYERIRARPSTR